MFGRGLIDLDFTYGVQDRFILNPFEYKCSIKLLNNYDHYKTMYDIKSINGLILYNYFLI